MVLFSSRPDAQGLYDPRHEHDSCGVGAVAHVRGERSHAVVRDALAVLHRLDHRGAEGSEPTTGDGAGILLQVPDALIRATTDLDLPAPGHYATGLAFVPVDDDAATKAISLVERIAVEEELEVLGWREVPVDPEGAEVGSVARGVMPRFVQVVVAAGDRSASGLALDRLAWVLRKRVERESAEQGCGLYLASLSSRTMTYKGMLTTDQLPAFFGDLRDERLVSAIAIVHSRFSTNTFPSWPLAHPYRAMAHNGEFNTIRGNRNRMRAREALLATDAFPGDLQRAMPICPEEVSDSASFDEVLELLALGGRPLPHAVMMMMPEAWENHAEMPADQRDFYRFHAGLMEPWDGPAAVVFSDGALLGATLDRNGLRPARWWRLADDRVVLASESGVLDVEPSAVVAKGRLRPGRMFLVDTEAGEVVDDEAYKSELAAAAPYGEWLRAGLVHLDDLPAREHVTHTHASVVRRQQTFGYTEEDLRVLLAPMASTGAEPLGSMGTDTPSAALSARPRLLYDYFVQLFAQVTNPPLDAIREELVTCMARAIGPEQNLFHPGPASCRQVVIAEPVISTDDLAKLIGIDDDGEHPTFAATVISGLYPVGEAVDAERSLAGALDRVRREASAAIAAGRRVLVLSDRDSDADHAPIPSLLLTSAVHHHLVATRERTQAALVVESGDAREVHHVALLLGYGAAAVNPYLAFESIEDMIAGGWLDDLEPAAAIESYRRALVKGVRKVMSKMGISTVSGYTAAQAFEAVGLSQDFVDEFFFGTSSKLGGGGLDVVAAENGERHRRAYPENPGERAHRGLDVGGEYAYRREGELHLFTPENVFLLQHATRTGQRDVFRRYTDEVDRTQREGGALRGLMRLRTGDDPGARPPVPLDEVEPVSAILTRFATGGMSWGSISEEAHTDLAVAMNRLGGRSNTGEGGENPDRLHDPERRSAIKQVASGRFGVTSEYLVNAEDLQIKMAQGAKPGEGGQLAGNKVHPWIANVRHSTPGVGLISPPPHHDIYSIEDLKQLIHDLKNANEHARIHTKLVSSVGVGTVAAGVAKAKSDVVLISGWEGGTGAAALTSLKHTGAPWEVGLADAQQTLILNGLRDRITVQVDGQLKTGRDVVVAMLLGAEEFGFGTAPLVVSGCIMMRVCHLDTCPVGVATQNPELRARYSGRPEFVENFFRFVAEQVREYLAELGFRTVAEAVGHAELLDVEPAGRRGKAEDLDLSPLFVVPEPPAGASTARRRTQAQDHGLDAALDRTLLPLAEPALRDGSPVRLATPVRNVHRTVGTMLGAEITRRHGGGGLPDDTVHLALHGSGGQSLGAFLPPGMTIDLVGDANDYLAKGLSGGRVIVRPHPDAPFLGPDESHTIAGNVIAYGATGGEVFLRGTVGERFCVRNSGALAVVEGVGDHACEYMTGGRVVVLGPTGRNLGAGMSGGIAYVLDLPEVRVNPELVALQAVGDDDADWLREVVGRHRDLTGSPRAAALLDDWDAAVGRFTTVMPTDFRRVLEAAERARAEGLDPDDAVMEVAGG